MDSIEILDKLEGRSNQIKILCQIKAKVLSLLCHVFHDTGVLLVYIVHFHPPMWQHHS